MHSPFKQEMFRDFLIQHASVCRMIGQRWATWEYLYLDMFGGPGYLPKFPEIEGSPIIARNLLAGMVPFKVHAFEEKASVAEILSRVAPDVIVHVGRCQDAIWSVLEGLDSKVKRCGLIYADPNSLSPADTSLVDTLARLVTHPVTRHLDILLHIGATAYKRVRNYGPYRERGAPGLADELERIGKRIIKVSRTDGSQQWTFILLTNYSHPQFGRSVGWYDVASDRGRLLLDRITLTEEQRRERTPDGYLFDPEDPE